MDETPRVGGRQPRVPQGARVYAVGDVHGRIDLLRALEAQIVADAASRAERCRNLLVYLGDYVDRGPNSKRVVDTLVDRPLPGFERFHLMGNHEAFLIEFLNDLEAGPGWFFNGGLATLASYGVKIGKNDELSYETLRRVQEEFRRKLPQSHLDFYTNLDFSRVEGDFFFVHAGIRPGVPLDNQTDEDMLWIREEFLGCDDDFGKVVVHGHTISWEPEVKCNRIGIDTGAFASGVLTALVLEGREQDFLAVTGPA
ncbi:MAG: serine/threonine protein phosphatase [Rhodospirillaceae bacterium]|nr:serine/threonine protein phosphatase [Rhodospirillaceae bacterium]